MTNQHFPMAAVANREEHLVVGPFTHAELLEKEEDDVFTLHSYLLPSVLYTPLHCENNITYNL